MTGSQGTVLTLMRPTSDGPNLLKALVSERHWTYSAFFARFTATAREIAKAEDEPRMRSVDVAKRTFMNWTSGTLKGLPSADACRVLERMFGYPVEALFAPASDRPAAPVAPEPVAEPGPVQPVQPVQAVPAVSAVSEGLAQLLAASGVATDPGTLATASQLANMLTVAFMAGAQFGAGPSALKAVA